MKKFIASIYVKFPKLKSNIYEKAFVFSYAFQNKIEYKKCCIIEDFLKENQKDYIEISDYINENLKLSNLDILIMAFEMLVESKEKKSKGIVYTPAFIRNYISSKVINSKLIPYTIDPSCGCGAFLISVAKEIRKRHNISYSNLFNNYLHGCDIDNHSIEKCKVLLSLLALQDNNEIIESFPNLKVCNSLDYFSSYRNKHKYDVVIGNPPYVRAKNIDESIKKSLSNWKVVSGNVDLYIPFYQLGIDLLKENGILGYISPNTFLQSVNGRGLRNYIRNIKASISIINFKETQNFDGVTHYTCISLIENNGMSFVNYALANDVNIDKSKFTQYNISSYKENQPWRFVTDEIDQLIYKIEHQSKKLDDYGIKNGLATLCNDLFFFTTTKEDKKYYYRTYKNKEYKIEKSICIDVAKPNIMHNESDLLSKVEKAIFPYDNGKIISENIMKLVYPYTYAFLSEYKEKLNSRDKGKTDKYPSWYAYGRTQGMNNQGLKLLVPYMADKGIAIISENKNLLFYCGYAVFAKDILTLHLLKLFIESDVFLFYIKMTSKPYSKGFVALAKNYIKNFGIPSLTDSQKKYLLELPDEERESYIASLYHLDYLSLSKKIKSLN